MHPAINKLTAPGQIRKGVWRGGILQIMVGRSCNESCHGCTQGSNLSGKPALMTPDEFETAVRSLGFGEKGQQPYFGIVGCFGGNPCMSPHFEEYCRILRGLVPFAQRGLWSNGLRGKGAHARITFNPATSNINVHLDSDAADEFRRDWPESAQYIKGEAKDSVHGPPFVAMKDVEPDVAKRWAMIADCDISRWWSACIGVVPGRGLRAYFCELAYAQAALHCDDPDWPDAGIVPHVGWWREPMAKFEGQVRLHCHACGIPLRRPGQLAINGTHEEFSETHRSIARPKTKGRDVQFVELGDMIERSERPATQYLKGVTPGYQGD